MRENVTEKNRKVYLLKIKGCCCCIKSALDADPGHSLVRPAGKVLTTVVKVEGCFIYFWKSEKYLVIEIVKDRGRMMVKVVEGHHVLLIEIEFR